MGTPNILIFLSSWYKTQRENNRARRTGRRRQALHPSPTQYRFCRRRERAPHAFLHARDLLLSTQIFTQQSSQT
ncbi:unnamed protein product [Pieris brassicae]|uniref:Uncharacterized protein n=1 Tax=Pieris brassicae TaxID=7116 RepID=A0A9P0XBA7_PIEBR|nr:unnamed protein product [Pieris brassicae]